MIDVAVSYRPSSENSYILDNIPVNIQLALFKYELYDKNKEFILKLVEKNPFKIKVVHLPLDTLHYPFEKASELMDDIFSRTGCVFYVIHPNKGIEKFLLKMQKKSPQYACVETFAWRKKKVFRSPLEIISAHYRWINTWMTLDTSHIEELWFDSKIMSYLLKFTKVIHLSNRAKGLGSHLPFNHQKGELNLVSFIRDLKYRYKWNGTIVLEYMPEYSHKLIKNCFYIKKLLGESK
ncbi:MAG: hypothetical protein ACFFG0_01960 [Candidatus Thorarchaeota archaeon]